MKIINEFKEFAVRGNVIDMAVGVIIGGAFGKIVTSLVNDVIMPAISLITGRVNLANLAVAVSAFGQGESIQIKYGSFLQNVLDFLIVSICIFAVIKMVNIFKKKQSEEAQNVKEETPSKEEMLLTEIRDILKCSIESEK